MNKKEFLQIGQIYREHGVNGVCKVYVFSQNEDNLEEGCEYVLLSSVGKEFKTKLEEIGSVGKFFLLKFEGFDSPEQVREEGWRKAEIWIAREHLKESDVPYDFEWAGMKLFDQDRNLVGEIYEVLYTPKATFVVGTPDGDEVLVPYEESWILDTNEDENYVFMELPEGILEV